MKTFNKMRFIPLLLTLLLVVMMAVPTMSMAAGQDPVPLGTASGFAVLAYSTITNTGSTIINGDAGGDIGVFSDGSITGFPPGTSGTPHLKDAAAIQAGVHLGEAYVFAADQPTTQDLTGQNLGERTLTPGVYSFSSSAQLTGDLTLDGNNEPDPVFIFKIGSTLTTADGAPGAPGSKVLFKNGARYCRTFWQVGSSATLGTYSQFKGHILAKESITATTGAEVQGQLLAQTGAVTLDSNPITNGICEDTPAPPAPPALATLHVIKHVINDDGRTADAADFDLYVKNSLGSDVTGSPASGNESGTTYTLDAGTYVVSEGTHTGYTVSYSGDSTDGNITLASGADKTVTVTNNDIHHSSGGAQSPIYPPLINVIKIPEPLALTSGQGSVTYTYKVTNPGMVALSNVRVTDDKVSPVNYVSGDVNADNLLQPNETWIYTGTMNLKATTTNTATAKGSANGMTATDIAFATVVVTPPVVVKRTVTGGQIPKTSTPLYELLLIGAALTLVGAVGWRSRKRYE